MVEDLGPFTLQYTRTHDVTSASNGRQYRVFVAAYPAPKSDLPVLYGLDANGGFGTLIETARMMMVAGDELEPMMIVGLGYPGDLLETRWLRNFEFTPSYDPGAVERAAAQGQVIGPDGLGGAPSFLQFIRDELAPLIESEYGASPTDRGIWGHSLGGLFATYALFQPEPVFQRYIIGSPSLWWNDREMFSLEEERAKLGGTLGARVFVSAGELEERPGDARMTPFRMVSGAIEMASRVASRGYSGLSVTSHIFPGESHVSVIGPTIARGLRVIYGKDN